MLPASRSAHHSPDCILTICIPLQRPVWMQQALLQMCMMAQLHWVFARHILDATAVSSCRRLVCPGMPRGRSCQAWLACCREQACLGCQGTLCRLQRIHCSGGCTAQQTATPYQCLPGEGAHEHRGPLKAIARRLYGNHMASTGWHVELLCLCWFRAKLSLPGSLTGYRQMPGHEVGRLR